MPSTHPRLRTLPTDLFSDLQSFRELERRISALPDGGLLRGDALEVFVEAHLQTSPLFQVEELWLVNQIPLSVRQQLGLENDSAGIDGVYRTSDGTLVPYQVKFREGRPQVGVGDVSSFFMLTESAAQRVLISNSDRYSKKIRDRVNLQIIGGLYFDELTAEDFARIHSWLRHKPLIPRRERPMRPHQARAVNAIVSRLRSDARATAVMPCGTGKTLVGLRVVEELKPRNVVVFVPSLALLAQLLEDWAKDTTWGKRFSYRCVCSEPSISAEVDRWALNPTDVHFPVKADPSVVRKFLKNDGGEDVVRVVFSTYQSAKKVADGLPRGFRFDVGLFDEAHKTTEGGFTLALHDESLPIDRRLFLTATPRHIDIKHRDKQGDFKVVSMDNPEVYGQPAFSQSFAEAVEEGIICDYRVVVATVDRSEVSEYAERYGITLVQGDENATRWVASQIAVTRAIEETGASKVITFHSRVRQAKDFASQTSRGIGQFLPGFGIGHVNGTQPVTDRKDVLSGFRGDGKMLVTNARCLTEGVDLPAVDAVVFNNPRRSKVDIVQAVGRAMRKPLHSKKELGYVVIPVLLEHSQTDDLEEACRGTEWEDLVAVLAALRDQDSRLDEIIRQAQEAAGRGEVFDPRPFGDQITILGRPQIPLSIIQRHVGAVILERLGQTWDYRYGQLKIFRDKHGHCNVPKRGADHQLGHWVVMQRQLWKRGVLDPNRTARLDALGFVWDTLEARWELQFEELQHFRARHGHCNISKAHDPQLAIWVVSQRQLRKQGKLSPSRIDRLNGIQFIWDTNAAAWESMCDALLQFKQEQGHCDVPAKYSLNRELGKWLSHQRQDYRRGKLSAERAAVLRRIGVEFDPIEANWEALFAELKQFQREKGHCNVSSKDNPTLASWLVRQRQLKKRASLPRDKAERLEGLGLVWDTNESVWEEKFRTLECFKLKHGHCKVSFASKADRTLYIWLINQRQLRRRGALVADRLNRLEALGVDWQTFDSRWNQRFAELEKFKKRYGHCDVSQSGAQHHSLSKWLNQQRIAKRSGQLPAQREKRLSSLGVVWDPLEAVWRKQFGALERFKSVHGHCRIPFRYSADPRLATWLRTQQKLQKCGELDASRAAQLEALGIEWDTNSDVWEKRFEELKEFKRQAGHTEVPASYKENKPLAAWVGAQRRIYKTNQLSAERKRRLESIGFLWEPNEALWQRQLAKLRSFKKRHGHCRVPLRYASDPELGRWLSNQRHLMRSGKLAKYRAKKLTELGVVWHQGANAWDSKFAALISFKRKHGHCNVPQREKENGGLGQWLSKQRSDKKKGRLPEDKAARLERLGVKWDALEDLWQTNLASLQKFHKRHGHCSPTSSTHAEMSLWVQMLRRLRKRGKLPEERIRQLNSLGMVWDPLDLAWEEKFRALSAFKKRYGHCNVPSRFDGDPELGAWLVNQRQRRRMGKLPAVRFKRLNSLGVNWNASRSKARQAVG